MSKIAKDKKKELIQTPKGTRDILPEEAHLWQKILEKALGPVFNHIVGTFVDSFVKRAHQVYD